MVMSCRLAGASTAYEKALGIDPGERARVKLNDLHDALVMAMKSIDNASEACSGKATTLTATHYEPGKCPFTLPAKLADKSTDEYLGHYHTDHTLPSTYFRPDVERPSDLTTHVLDFTYLHRPGADNPAYQTMGHGLRIRHDDSSTAEVPGAPDAEKRARFEPQRVPVEKCPLLVSALSAGV